MGRMVRSAPACQAPSTDDGSAARCEARGEKIANFRGVRNVSFSVHGATRIFAGTIATGAVEIVLCVSGFAQSNTGYRAMTGADHTSTLALREYVVAAHPPADAASLPSNLIAPSIYRDLLETMLQRSVTFRRQCLRIAQTPDLSVTLQAAGTPVAARVRARARI